jgi:hypothetical protein
MPTDGNWNEAHPYFCGDCGHQTEHVKRLKDLETGNARLRRAVSDLTLDKLILQEAAKIRHVPMNSAYRPHRDCQVTRHDTPLPYKGTPT